MLTAEQTSRKISLGNFVINILNFLDRENEQIKIILHDATKNESILIEDFNEPNAKIQKKAWENLILFIEYRAKNFSMDLQGKMNGAIAIKIDSTRLSCSVHGLPNQIENVFVSMKILEFQTGVHFTEILEKLEEVAAPLEKEGLLKMNANCFIK